jgi:hypothetical protein
MNNQDPSKLWSIVAGKYRDDLLDVLRSLIEDPSMKNLHPVTVDKIRTTSDAILKTYEKLTNNRMLDIDCERIP